MQKDIILYGYFCTYLYNTYVLITDALRNITAHDYDTQVQFNHVQMLKAITKSHKCIAIQYVCSNAPLGNNNDVTITVHLYVILTSNSLSIGTFSSKFSYIFRLLKAFFKTILLKVVRSWRRKRKTSSEYALKYFFFYSHLHKVSSLGQCASPSGDPFIGS